MFVLDIWHMYPSWYFKIVSNFMYNHFEISLVVFMPNITPNHAITYTNFDFGFQSLGIAEFQIPWAEFRIPKPSFADSTRNKISCIPGPDYISLRYMGRLTGKQEGSLPLKLKDVYGERVKSRSRTINIVKIYHCVKYILLIKREWVHYREISDRGRPSTKISL